MLKKIKMLNILRLNLLLISFEPSSFPEDLYHDNSLTLEILVAMAMRGERPVKTWVRRTK